MRRTLLVIASLLCAAALYGAVIGGYFDLLIRSGPGNPASGTARVYVDSGTNLLTCVLSTGTSCMPGGTGGMNFQGSWSGITAYAAQDVVRYGGHTYVCTSAVGSATGAALVQARAATRASVFLAISGTNRSMAFGSTVTVGNLLLLAFADEGTVDPSTVSDTLGTTWTKLSAITGNLHNAAVYAGVAPSSGADTVSFTSGGAYPTAALAEFSGLSGSLDGSAVAAYNSSSPVTVNVPAAGAAEMIVVMAGGYHNINFYAGAGLTLDSQSNAGDAIVIGHVVTGAPGTYTVGFNVTAGAADNTPTIGLAFLNGATPPSADTGHWTLIG